MKSAELKPEPKAEMLEKKKHYPEPAGMFLVGDFALSLIEKELAEERE